MREAIGSSLLLSIVVVFVSLIILFFVGILSYSKAYKAKNRIIDVIEKYDGYENQYDENGKNIVEDEIISSLSEMGYQVGNCENSGNINKSGYKYCVYRIDTEKDGHYYYKVTTYVQFYFPIINELFKPAVTSETKILGENYNY